MNNVQKIIKIAAICFAVFIIINIINILLIGINAFTGTREETISFEETYINIKNIDIELKTSSLIIENGEELKIEAYNVGKGIETKNNNQTLTIIENNPNIFWKKNAQGKIKITIPKNVILGQLNIASGIGKMKLSNIRGTILNLSQGTGSIKMDNITFEESKMNGGIGEMQISSSVLNNLDLEVGVGKIDIEGKILGKSNIECGVGELILKLDDLKNYELSLEKGIGSIKIDGKEYKNDTIVGNGENKIKIDGGIGSITIK